MNNKITRDRYEARVKAALDYIHDHLDQPLDLTDVAGASHFSPYHFHRIFRALIGETLNEYIRRQRMELAAKMLAYEHDYSITDIAFQCGYSSSSNFSKTFSAYFGCSPTEVRHPEKFTENSKIGELKRKHGKDFDPRKFYPEFIHQTKENMMNVDVIEIKEKRVAVLQSPQGYDEKTVMQTWDKLSEWGANNRLIGADFFGACYDDPTVTPLKKCKYEAMLTVKPDTVIAAPFEEKIIPAGKYAMAYYRGPQDPDSKLHIGIYQNWFPTSGFEPDDYPLLERYLNDCCKDEYTEMQIMIKIKE